MVFQSFRRLNSNIFGPKGRFNELKLIKELSNGGRRSFWGSKNLVETTSTIERKTQDLIDTTLIPLNERTRGPIDSNLTNRIPGPTVMLLGNHSSGKSSFINYLLKEKIQDTGVAPTDDGFTIITHGEQYLVRDGPSLVGDTAFGFGGLMKFGPRLVNQLKLKVLPSAAIKDIIFIDSPGMIDSPLTSAASIGAQSKEIRMNERGYDFEAVVKWMAEKADVILLFFDPDKPGTTGETLSVLTNSLSGLDYKLYIVMNKADQFEKVHDFARAYGSLCWNLSKVIYRKDLPRIYTTYTPVNEDQEKLNIASNSKLNMDDLEQMRKDLIDVVLSAPSKRVDNMITQLYTNAKLLNLHLEMLALIKIRCRSEKLRTYGMSLILPTFTIMTDVFLSYNNLITLFNISMGTAFSGLASIGIFAYFNKNLGEFTRNVTSDRFLQNAFEDLYYEGDEPDEELKSLWHLEKPKLKATIKLFGVSNLPKVKSSDLASLYAVLNKDVPTLRKATSHLVSSRMESVAGGAVEDNK